MSNPNLNNQRNEDLLIRKNLLIRIEKLEIKVENIMLFLEALSKLKGRP